MILYNDYLKLILSIFKINTFRKNVILNIITIDNIKYIIIFLKYLFFTFFKKSISLLFKININKIFNLDKLTSIFRDRFTNFEYIDYYFKHFFKKNVIIIIKNENILNDII